MPLPRAPVVVRRTLHGGYTGWGVRWTAAFSRPNRAAADRFGDPPILLMRRKLRCGRLTVGSAPQRFPAGTSRNIAGQAVCTSAPCTAHRCRRLVQRRQPPRTDLLSGRLAVNQSAPTGRGGIVYRRDLLFLAHHPSLVYPLCSPRLPSVPSLGGSGAPPVYLMEGGWGGRLRARLTRFYALLQVPTWCCTPPSFGVMRVALSPTTGAAAITSEAAFSCRTDAV
eukprot:COSAG01_NODE_13903_length_1519_cov_8.427465_2_plen_224_part_00